MHPPRRTTAVLLLLTLLLPASRLLATDLTTSIDFPGGSAEVQQIDQTARKITLLPTDHKDRGWRCWWYVKVAGITPGETLTLDVGEAPWATPDRAAFSIDGGKTWRQTEKGQRAGKRIVYKQPIDTPEALFAWGPPFLPTDGEALVKRLAEQLNGKDGVKAEAFELCKSLQGRGTPALRLTPPGQPGRRPLGLFVCARQHAWESGGSWVGRGFIEFLASDDPAARALRQRAIIYFVPVMDVDNVAIGAGGKNQKPHDHNRDWLDKPEFPAVAASQKIIRDLNAAGTLDLFLDLHNPAAGDLRPFFFVGEDRVGRPGDERFLALAAKHIVGPPALLPKGRPSGASYDKEWKAISRNWVADHTDPRVISLTLETSWNTPHGTAEGYMAVGRQLGTTVVEYFTTDPPPTTRKAD
jgi:hypothetical protein